MPDHVDHSSDHGKIQLYSGTMFNPLKPDPAAITIADIAHAGAMQCRYGGHCKFFYSVNEHAILVSNMLEEWGFDVRVQLQGLLHDSDEALGLPDLPRPVKVNMPEYKKAGERVQEVVFTKYGLGWPMDPAVHLADNSILFLYERPKLMGLINDSFWNYDGELRKSVYAVRPENIQGMAPEQAEYIFNMRFEHLYKKFKNG